MPSSVITRINSIKYCEFKDMLSLMMAVYFGILCCFSFYTFFFELTEEQSERFRMQTVVICVLGGLRVVLEAVPMAIGHKYLTFLWYLFTVVSMLHVVRARVRHPQWNQLLIFEPSFLYNLGIQLYQVCCLDVTKRTRLLLLGVSWSVFGLIIIYYLGLASAGMSLLFGLLGVAIISFRFTSLIDKIEGELIKNNKQLRAVNLVY